MDLCSKIDYVQRVYERTEVYKAFSVYTVFKVDWDPCLGQSCLGDLPFLEHSLLALDVVFGYAIFDI